MTAERDIVTSVEQNVSSRLHECPCGASLIEGTYYGDRGILDVRRDIVECPVVLRCMNDHIRELWMQHDQAMEAIGSIIQVAR